MPINQPEDQPQGNSQLIKFIHQCQRKISFAADVNAQNDIKTMLSIALDATLAIKDLSKLTDKELDKKIEEIALLKNIKCKNQNGIKTSEGFELFNSINDHWSAIVKAIKDNRLEQKQKKNGSAFEAVRSKFEAFRSKLKRGFGSPQEREIEVRYAITIQARLNGIKANLNLPNLTNNVSADLPAEQPPHVPSNNIGHNSTQGGSGNNHQEPKSFTEMVDKIAKDASDQGPTPPPAGPKGATTPPLARDTQGDIDFGKLFFDDPVDDLEAGISPSPSPRNRGPEETQSRVTRLPTLFLRPSESGAATRAPSYQPPKSKESESTLVVPPKKDARTPPPHTQTTVKAGIQFFSQGGGAKASTKLDALVARREELLKARAVAITANALKALPGEFAKGVEAGRKKLAESPNNPNNRKTGR